MKLSQDNLIWIDLEMTGLDPNKDRIIEIATVVTDKNLQVLAEGPFLAIHQSTYKLNKMDDWCLRTHGSSGLTNLVKKSKITISTAEKMTLDFLQNYVPSGVSPMCGNTIAQDRRFLCKYMPTLEKYFHYRNFDVSVLKMIAKKWYPALTKEISKKVTHRALNDVYDSIDEMKFYLKNLLISQI